MEILGKRPGRSWEEKGVDVMIERLDQGVLPEFDEGWVEKDKRLAGVLRELTKVELDPVVADYLFGGAEKVMNFRQAVVEPMTEQKVYVPNEMVYTTMGHFNWMRLLGWEKSLAYREGKNELLCLGFNLLTTWEGEAGENDWEVRIPRVVLMGRDNKGRAAMTLMYLSPDTDPADDAFAFGIDDVLYAGSYLLPEGQRLRELSNALKTEDINACCVAFAYAKTLKGVELIDVKDERGYGVVIGAGKGRKVVGPAAGVETNKVQFSSIFTKSYRVRHESGGWRIKTSLRPTALIERFGEKGTIVTLREKVDGRLQGMGVGQGLVELVSGVVVERMPYLDPRDYNVNNPKWYDKNWWEALEDELDLAKGRKETEIYERLKRELGKELFQPRNAVKLGVVYVATLAAENRRELQGREMQIGVSLLKALLEKRFWEADMIRLVLDRVELLDWLSEGRESLIQGLGIEIVKREMEMRFSRVQQDWPEIRGEAFGRDFWFSIVERVILGNATGQRIELRRVAIEMERKLSAVGRLEQKGQSRLASYLNVGREYRELVLGLVERVVREAKEWPLGEREIRRIVGENLHIARIRLDVKVGIKNAGMEEVIDDEAVAMREKMKSDWLQVFDWWEMAEVVNQYLPEEIRDLTDIDNLAIYDRRFWGEMKKRFDGNLGGARAVLRRIDWASIPSEMDVATVMRYVLGVTYQIGYYVARNYDRDVANRCNRIMKNFWSGSIRTDIDGRVESEIALWLLKELKFVNGSVSRFENREDLDAFVGMRDKIEKAFAWLGWGRPNWETLREMVMGEEFYGKVLGALEAKEAGRGVARFGTDNDKKRVERLDSGIIYYDWRRFEHVPLEQRYNDVEVIVGRLVAYQIFSGELVEERIVGGKIVGTRPEWRNIERQLKELGVVE